MVMIVGPGILHISKIGILDRTRLISPNTIPRNSKFLDQPSGASKIKPLLFFRSGVRCYGLEILLIKIREPREADAMGGGFISAF
jgi:hypothetical protein